MSKVRIALVLGDDKDSDLQLVDIVRIQPLAPNIFLMELEPFDNSLLVNGAGPVFTREQIHILLSTLFPH